MIFPLIKFLFCRHKKLKTKIFWEVEESEKEENEEYEMEEKGHATNLEGQHHKSSGRKSAKLYPDSAHHNQLGKFKALHLDSSTEEPNDSKYNSTTESSNVDQDTPSTIVIRV
ncbi:unnamed protein product [Rotaria magnacalcarata]|nr:unnamed protein product [Rotaria magnacalcarata]CAF2217941.1 unnamed protein product [Rotaria magnacalcarata]CAF4180422.1 unnamed protein product [Rotaria magnacalcarata]CAF4271481.1 unnamed protein product [Rotaria magnacalcarata]CAF5168743.1 unnamed protein product [Rotaria magnacalcarata]